MSEGYTIDGYDDEVAGIVVRYHGERGFRFHAASKTYYSLDGHVFGTPAAAERAARDLGRTRLSRPDSAHFRGAPDGIARSTSGRR
jgi:hypothetical protein